MKIKSEIESRISKDAFVFPDQAEYKQLLTEAMINLRVFLTTLRKENELSKVQKGRVQLILNGLVPQIARGIEKAQSPKDLLFLDIRIEELTREAYDIENECRFEELNKRLDS